MHPNILKGDYSKTAQRSSPPHAPTSLSLPSSPSSSLTIRSNAPATLSTTLSYRPSNQPFFSASPLSTASIARKNSGSTSELTLERWCVLRVRKPAESGGVLVPSSTEFRAVVVGEDSALRVPDEEGARDERAPSRDSGSATRRRLRGLECAAGVPPPLRLLLWLERLRLRWAWR